MPFPLKAGPSRQLVGAFAVFASLGCSTLPSEPEPHSNILPTDSHSAQLDSLVSPIPRESIPCGRVHGLVIDEDAMRVVGDAQVHFVSLAGRASASSSSGHYFDVQPVDTTVIVVQVMRKNGILFESTMGFVPFRRDSGHRMILLLSAKGVSSYMESGFCPGKNGDYRTPDREPMIHAPIGIGGR